VFPDEALGERVQRAGELLGIDGIEHGNRTRENRLDFEGWHRAALGDVRSLMEHGR
jgi:hypothetical protein